MPATLARKGPRRTSRVTLSDEIRDAIERDGRTPYAIARAAAVDAGIISRFLSGRRAMTTDTLDRLAATLGFHLTAATRSRGRSRASTVPAAIDAAGAIRDVPEAGGAEVPAEG